MGKLSRSEMWDGIVAKGSQGVKPGGIDVLHEKVSASGQLPAYPCFDLGRGATRRPRAPSPPMPPPATGAENLAYGGAG